MTPFRPWPDYFMKVADSTHLTPAMLKMWTSVAPFPGRRSFLTAAFMKLARKQQSSRVLICRAGSPCLPDQWTAISGPTSAFSEQEPMAQ